MLNTPQYYIKYAFGFLIVLSVFSCARIGSPPGGPKDETKPVPVKAKPENMATNYNRKNIYIQFDEWITLNSIYDEFTVSPPLEETPTPRLKGKGVFTELDYREMDSVTYTLDFGQAIADLNEGNTLENFQFVVSKQAYIDSFSISGYVVDAYTLLPDEERLVVQLYKSAPDTAAFSTRPSYLGKTNNKGYFEINHIAPGTYSVFALKDFNSNMFFDLPTEVIAFSDRNITLDPDSFPSGPDTIVQPHFHDKEQPGTGNNETGNDHGEPPHGGREFSAEGESLKIDSSQHAGPEHQPGDTMPVDSSKRLVYGYSLKLYSFTEEQVKKQYLSDYTRKSKENFQLIFNDTLDSLPKIRLIQPDTVGMWYLLEASENLDTLTYWLADSNMVNKDTIIVEAIYPKTDTNNVAVPFTDTLDFIFKAEKGKEKSEDKKKGNRLLNLLKDEEVEEDTTPQPKKEPRLAFNTNIKSSGHDLNVPIIISPAVPTFEYNQELIQAYRIEDDSVEVPVNYEFIQDSSSYQKAVLKMGYEPSTRYRLKFIEGCMRDIYGRTVDTTIIDFGTQRDDFYGILNLTITGVKEPTIVLMLDSKDKILQKRKIYQDEKLVFDYLKSGQYKFKVIIDANDNDKWDTGYYLGAVQPEKVYYFPQLVDVKENWTIEYEWQLGDNESMDPSANVPGQEDKSEKGKKK